VVTIAFDGCARRLLERLSLGRQLRHTPERMKRSVETDFASGVLQCPEQLAKLG